MNENVLLLTVHVIHGENVIIANSSCCMLTSEQQRLETFKLFSFVAVELLHDVTCSMDTSRCRTQGYDSDPGCVRSRAGPP